MSLDLSALLVFLLYFYFKLKNIPKKSKIYHLITKYTKYAPSGTRSRFWG